MPADFDQLVAAAYIVSGFGQKGNDSDLRTTLSRRLEDARKLVSDDDEPPKGLENPERDTALYSLFILEGVQRILDTDQTKLVGTRDLAQFRTLLSIVFRWAIEPAYNDSSVPSEGNNSTESLIASVVRLWAFIFPPWETASTPSPSTSTYAATRTHITQTLLSRHLSELLRPSLFIVSLETARSETDGAYISECLSKLLALLPASQIISALGTVLSTRPGIHPLTEAARKECSKLLGLQLLRDDGVDGLLASMFGDASTVEDASLAKLEQVSRLLVAPPATMEPLTYYRAIVPKLLNILRESAPSASAQNSRPVVYQRAVAFTLARMMNKRSTAEIITPILRHTLYTPFTSIVPTGGPSSSLSSPGLTTSHSLRLMGVLFANADPSPAMIGLILAPLVVPLGSLSAFLDSRRGAILNDPGVRDMSRGLLMTWARVASVQESRKRWWDVINGVDGWGVDIDDGRGVEGARCKEWAIQMGELVVVERLSSTDDDLPRLVSEPTPSSSAAGVDLRPDPAHLVGVLKDLNRKDVSGSMFLRCLDEYRTVSTSTSISDMHPLRIVLLLNIILEMIDKLGSSILLGNSEQILSFIAHTLEPPPLPQSAAYPPPPETASHGLRLDDLRIVDSDDEDEDHEVNADLEAGMGIGSEGVPTNQDLLFTALNLLLAVLEGNESLSPANTPLLQVIFAHLEPLTNHSSDSIRKTALEARLVITTRRASGVASSTQKNSVARPDVEVYQEALRLVQDPILPVRAHGLLMLRQLIVPPHPPTPSASQKATSPSHSDPTEARALHKVDPALIPGILDVFVQSVQDDDSFVFLNAVQGLSAMVDKLGRSILIRLMDLYAGTGNGTTNRSLTKAELDKRLRIGEALGQVVKRCGESLGGFTDIMVPKLIRVFRSSSLPTNLRASSLSILATCVEVSSIAMVQWTDELVSGMIDLLQVETVSFAAAGSQQSSSNLRPEPKNSGPQTEARGSETNDDDDRQPSEPRSASVDRHRDEDSVPALSVSAKQAPILRRSALHFLSLLLRSFILRSFEQRDGGGEVPFTTGTMLSGLATRSSAPNPSSSLLSRGLSSGPSVVDASSPLGDDAARRLGIVVRYISETDVDGIVRAQASECADLVGQMAEARLGL